MLDLRRNIDRAIFTSECLGYLLGCDQGMCGSHNQLLLWANPVHVTLQMSHVLVWQKRICLIRNKAPKGFIYFSIGMALEKDQQKKTLIEYVCVEDIW